MPIEVHCEICGKKKFVNPYKFKNQKHHFCSIKCHGKWMETHNPSKSKYDKNEKRLLEKLYIEEGLSMNQIKKVLGKSSIQYLLNKYNISRRDRIIALKERLLNKTKISSELIEIIEGNLLGDGCLVPTKNQAFYQHGSSQVEYLIYLCKKFEEEGLMTPKGYPKRYQHKNNKAVYYNMYSKSNICLRKLYDKWYPHGFKIVPKDLELTSTKVLYWFIGDGSTNGREGISLHSQGFTKEENIILQDKLLEYVGIRSSLHSKVSGSGYTIYIPKKYKNIFYDYIGECPVKCYKYKWI